MNSESLYHSLQKKDSASRRAAGLIFTMITNIPGCQNPDAVNPYANG